MLSSYFLFEQLIKPKDLVLYSQELDFDSIPHMNVPYKKNIQQAIKTSIDKRYHTFWTEYLTQDRPRDNLKVISWNYDMQFEASYSHIKNYGLELTQQNLQVFPSTISNIDINVVDLSTQG